MRTSHFLFAASTLLLVIVLGGFVVSSSVGPSAVPNPDYPTVEMTEVGSTGTVWWGYAMALAILATLTAAVLIGLETKGRVGELGMWLGAGFAVLALIFTALTLSYVGYASGDETRLFLGLPPPTAWMLYGVWLFPLAMIVVCVWHFERWYFSDEDQEVLDRWTRSTRSKKDDG